MNLIFLCLDICNYICLDTSDHFSVFTFLNIRYFFKYSCTNIFHRRSLYTFYYMGIVMLARRHLYIKSVPMCYFFSFENLHILGRYIHLILLYQLYLFMADISVKEYSRLLDWKIKPVARTRYFPSDNSLRNMSKRKSSQKLATYLSTRHCNHICDDYTDNSIVSAKDSPRQGVCKLQDYYFWHANPV